MAVVAFRSSDFVTQTETQKENNSKIVIAIDGPAASGKGTLAQSMADRFGYAYLDTGSLYRAVAFALLAAGGDVENEKDVKTALDMINENLTPELLASEQLRTSDVSQASSKVAALPLVREFLLDYQRNFIENPPFGVAGVILDGRDIGTVVCPDADIKMFVTANVEARAQRRYEELKEKGQDVTAEQVLLDIKQRDARDGARALAPMRAAKDAFTLDTSNLKCSEVLGEAVNLLRARMIEKTA